MRRAVRENAPCALAAAAASAAMAWLGLYGFAWNDYEIEAQPAFNALTHGHVLEFLRLAPAYGGSLVERAPFALLPGLWGGGQLAVYRMVALPCLLAGAALGVWLCAQLRAAGRPPLWRAVSLGVCVANPLTLQALELGHPEELLGACLCVAAVLLASRGHPIWAGVLLGLAIANKEWALLAAGPVLLALTTGPGRSRRRQTIICLTSAGAIAAIVLAPLLLVSSDGFAAGTRAAASPQSTIFQPWQLWWFLGRHSPSVHGLFGAPKPGYRAGPAWTGMLSHPLIIVVGLGLAGALWWQRRRPTGTGSVSERDALRTLALVLLARCVLDTWDTVYYVLPFVLALLAWETCSGSERLPVLALTSTALTWICFKWMPLHASPDAQAACFLAWTGLLGVWLALGVYAPTVAIGVGGSHGGVGGSHDGITGARSPANRRATPGSGPIGPAPTQEMTVSSLGSPVSTS
jgi:Glycosyltransferase family 87